MTKKINLSNRSIDLLKSDNARWFKGYVLGQRESEFKPYFAIGECFASCMDAYCKLGDFNSEHNLAVMEKKFKDNDAEEEDLAKAVLAVTEALNNFRTLELPKPIESEKEIIVPLTEKYNLKVKFDAFYGDYILDHKTVDKAFTKDEDAEEKYGQQMRLYQYARYKHSGEKLPIYIQEIKKSRVSISKDLKKEDLLALVPEDKHAELKTVNDLKDYLRTHPLKEWCGKRFEFAWTDNLIEECEDLLRRAMIKADYLQTLSLEDIL